MVDLRAGNVSIHTRPEPTLKPFKKIDTLGQYGHESLKGARPCFVILDSRYFYTTKSQLLGDFGAEIKKNKIATVGPDNGYFREKKVRHCILRLNKNIS
jgi:hypothetical protein